MDKELYKDIRKALIKINNKRQNNTKMFHSHSSIYPFTTENIKGYYKKSEIEGKDILTVCSSGDHLFNAMLMDAKNVDCFDINILSKYFMHLKLGAIKVLDYDDFLKFFIKSDRIYIKNLFDEKKYTKIREVLDEHIKTFWDNLFINKKGKRIRHSQLFSDDENSLYNIIKCNNYLDKNNYYKLKGKIEKYNPKFYNVNIIDLPQTINKKYDVIYLSNLAKYIYDIFNSHNLSIYKNFILENLLNKLNENGLIFLAYIYDYVDYDDNFKCYYKIDDYNERKKVFNTNEFQIRDFISAYQDCKEPTNDAVVIYKKVR